ncbi:MAG TPA: serine O-acetyltransferase [Alphaproteobacteria bacterium]|nr:serine O-acetyltransferase [Alphaproteobacteria bacterium]
MLDALPLPADPAALDEDALWPALRGQAEGWARREPALAGLVARQVLAHDGLLPALAAVLAARLASADLPEPALRAILAEALAADPAVPTAIQADLEAHQARNPGCPNALTAFLLFKGFHAVQAHRAAHVLWRAGRRPMALVLQSRNSEIFAVDIHPAARLGAGLFIDHATGIVIGETAVVGDNVSLLHEVTLGGTGKESGDRHPKIGPGVLIGAGAKVLGNIAVGAGAKIGAGSVVLHPVPPHVTVAGVPARIVGGCKSAAPAFDMDHSLPE